MNEKAHKNLLEERRAQLERLFDMGYHGHAEQNKERWVTSKLEAEGWL